MVSKKKRGRKADPTSKSGKIRKLLETDMTAAEIAKKVGCTVALVYNLTAKATGGTSSKKKRGRKPAALGSSDNSDLSAILTAVKNAEKERTQMRTTLEKISSLIDEALA